MYIFEARLSHIQLRRRASQSRRRPKYVFSDLPDPFFVFLQAVFTVLVELFGYDEVFNERTN